MLRSRCALDLDLPGKMEEGRKDGSAKIRVDGEEEGISFPFNPVLLILTTMPSLHWNEG